MKVALINTADAGGGAPMACMRLLKALQLKQVAVTLQVQDKKTNNPEVKTIDKGFFSRLKIKFNFFAERLPFIWFYAKEKSLRFAFSSARVGSNISKEAAIMEADVLHLHWTNSGYLSTQNIQQLFETNKPIVWTLHDMWTFTGGCHYAADCTHFENECGNCWMLKYPAPNDISHADWQLKKQMYAKANNLVFVTCSNWLAEIARSSTLLNGFRIEAIPNPIDTNLFSPKNKTQCREKWGIDLEAKIILFGAANILDRRKGITYLIDALEDLKNNYNQTENIQVVIFGKNKAFDVTMLPFKVYELNLISKQEELAELYSLADVFVSPTIEDNLPNTIMEALACGTPVVAFNTGGVPDMVTHLQNGYLANYKQATDFAAGINYVLNTADHDELATNARQKVMQSFTNDIVAEKYLAVYNSMLKKKN